MTNRRKKGSSSKAKKKAVSSVQHLKNAVYGDLLPTDSNTNEMWGFDRAKTTAEASLGPNHLLGLYQGLMKYLDIDTQQLDQWRQKGILVAEIKAAYEKIPAASRGAYYPWLLRNEYVLDRSQPIPSSDTRKAENAADAILQTGWNYATNNRAASLNTIHNTVASWPVRKQECVKFCGLVLHFYSPSPDLDMWLHFGFCVGDRRWETEALEMYRDLFRWASFDEFYQAYEDSQLVNLLERQGLTQSPGYERIEEEFRDVVDGSAKGVLKSSWYLKVFIENNPSPLLPQDGLNIEQSVYMDYGWMNCEDLQSTNRLLRVYQRYFNSPLANCLKLHSACITGTLAEYLQNIPDVRLQKEEKPLLKNLYPLFPPDERFDAPEQSVQVSPNPAAPGPADEVSHPVAPGPALPCEEVSHPVGPGPPVAAGRISPLAMPGHENTLFGTAVVLAVVGAGIAAVFRRSLW